MILAFEANSATAWIHIMEKKVSPKSWKSHIVRYLEKCCPMKSIIYNFFRLNFNHWCHTTLKKYCTFFEHPAQCERISSKSQSELFGTPPKGSRGAKKQHLNDRDTTIKQILKGTMELTNWILPINTREMMMITSPVLPAYCLQWMVVEEKIGYLCAIF